MKESEYKVSNTKERLAEVMAKKNLKQIDVLRLCEKYCKEYNVKMGKSDISQYLSGKVEPQQDKLFVLAKALDVSLEWLMGYGIEIALKVSPEQFETIKRSVEQDQFMKITDPDEIELIEAYRSQIPAIRNAARRVLGLKEDGGSGSEERGVG